MIVPVPLGSVNETLTVDELVTIAKSIIGESDIVDTEDDGIDADDVPLELVAVTVNVYNVFCVNPDTVIGEVVPVAISPKLLVTV